MKLWPLVRCLSDVLRGRLRGRLRLWGAVAALVTLAACSTLKLTYNNADMLVRYRVSDYVDFTPAQTEQFKARFATLHRWHRSEELPAYAELVRQAGNKISLGLSAEDVSWAISNARSRYRKLTARAAADAAPIVASFTREQLQQVEKKFSENNRKFARDYLEGDPRSSRHKRATQLEDYFRDWIGHLNDPQEQRIDRFVDEFGHMQALRLEDRQRTQQEFLALARAERDPVRLAPRLAALFSNPEAGRSAEFRSAMARYEAEIAALILDIDRLLSPQQRRRAERRALDYAEDFTILNKAHSAAGAGAESAGTLVALPRADIVSEASRAGLRRER